MGKKSRVVKEALTTWTFPNAPYNEWSESLKAFLNRLGENENVDV
jgi:hypothetical protein